MEERKKARRRYFADYIVTKKIFLSGKKRKNEKKLLDLEKHDNKSAKYVLIKFAYD